MKTGWINLIMLCIMAMAAIPIFYSCSPQNQYNYGQAIPSTFSSNGQRIYFTGTSGSGDPIYSEGFTMMGRGFACADCHGPQGKGGTVAMMMNRFDVPAITWPELTGQHEDHPPYTEDTVKQAITRGIDPAGNRLEPTMPRWTMSERDLNDLINFLKTLK